MIVTNGTRGMSWSRSRNVGNGEVSPTRYLGSKRGSAQLFSGVSWLQACQIDRSIGPPRAVRRVLPKLL